MGLVHILAALGAVLVGIAVLLIVGSNWEENPRVARLAILIVATALSYYLGYRLAYNRAALTLGSDRP